MDIIEAIKAKKNYYMEDLTEEQQYVLDYETEERVTAFSCFPERQSGRSTAVCLKAIKLSEIGNKRILVFVSSITSAKMCCDTTLRIMHDNNFDILGARSHQMEYSITLKNGSHIRFAIANESNTRGAKSNYVLVDDLDLIKNQHIMDCAALITMNDKDGQVYYFLGGK